MSESTQKKLSRIRPPRVQITYDLEVNGDVKKTELPLVVGILADLAGDPDPGVTPVPVKDRKFVDIDRDNFNDVMKSIGPRLELQELNVELRFNSLKDLSPESLIQQIGPLRELFEERQRLNDLVAKLDGNDALDRQLKEISPETLKGIQKEKEELEQKRKMKQGTEQTKVKPDAERKRKNQQALEELRKKIKQGNQGNGTTKGEDGNV